MIFRGIGRRFSLKNEAQYDSIGAFWDEMTEKYGIDQLRGLGYRWENGEIYYAIGHISGNIDGQNVEIELPDDGWTVACGRTDDLKAIYDEIYKHGSLLYEIESFREDGLCRIEYVRR